MKKIIILLLSICTTSFSQNLASAEYFVDTDPGVGNGVAITGLSGSQSNFAANIPTNLLSQGFHTVGIRAKYDNDTWGLFEKGMFYISSSTTNKPNIVAAEFFVDADPGVGLGTAITPITAGQTTSFVASIPTATLSNGFHTLAIRTKDVDGNWGFYEKGMFYISNSSTNKPNIVAAEFFVDVDPGVGLGTAITPITAGQTTSFVAIIPTTTLSNGFHTLAIRTKDVDGNWGFYEKGMFYISNSSTNKPNIVAAEFFVDSDPGVGLGTAITPITAGQTTSFVASIPTASLTNGFHTLAIRTKDVDGNWGFYEKGMFYISNSSTSKPNIVAAEYFVDADPGVGLSTAITPISDGQTVNFVANIPTASLPLGFHTLAIRTKDLDGNWGFYEKAMFYISPNATPAGDITKGEYFFDNDPGQGNGFPLVTPVSQSFVQNFALNVPRTLMDGEHIVAIRMFDDWGLTDAKIFTVDGVALPLNLLNFSVKKEENLAKLNWQTANEVNTSHFEIERSSGQINFKAIGKVSANNQIENNNYEFSDEKPENGVLYYRLKMIDLDGKYSYSPIRSILFDNKESEFTVFPSPADQTVTVDLKKTYSRVKAEIINSIGKELGSKRLVDSSKFDMEVSHLTPGIYFIRITESAGSKEIKFLKR